MSVLIYEKRDQVAYITLNRPEVLNAIDSELNEALRTLSKTTGTTRLYL